MGRLRVNPLRKQTPSGRLEIEVCCIEQRPLSSGKKKQPYHVNQHSAAKSLFLEQIPRVLESNTGSVSVQILFFYLVTLFYFFILSPSSVFLTCHPLLFFYLVTLFCFFILSPSSVFLSCHPLLFLPARPILNPM